MALCCIGTIAIGLSGDPSKPGPGAPQGRVLSTATPTSPITPTAVAAPKPGDIKRTAKITHRECFGSAGCNVDFEVTMTYSGPTLSDTDTWRVTYEVHGVEDGPLIDTLDVTGTHYKGTAQSASLTRASDKLTVEVTDVELR